MQQPSDPDFRISTPLETYVVHEEIRGPVFGFWLACYAIERRRGFYAYGKLCRERPSSVWDTPSAIAKIVLGPRATAEAALDAVFCAVEARLQRRHGAQTPQAPQTSPATEPPAEPA